MKANVLTIPKMWWFLGLRVFERELSLLKVGTLPNFSAFLSMQDKHHGQCWQASCNFLDELLDETGWDDGAPTLATSTETPVCSRHLAILWSFEEGHKVWGGEERWRGDRKGRKGRPN